MTDFEERFRHLLRDLSKDAPASGDRATLLHRKITRRRRFRTVGLAGALVLVLAGAGAGLVTLRPAAHRTLGTAGAVSATPSHAALTGPENILLAGEDPYGTSADGGADAIMILHLSADHRTGYLISIPRDTGVRIPAYNNGAQSYPGGEAKLNMAYGYGARGLTGTAARRHGLDLLSKTVTALSGITFNATASANLAGVEQVIDAIGGINLYVDEKTISTDLGYDRSGNEAVPFKRDGSSPPMGAVPGVTPVVYNVGNQHLTGAQAIDYIRQRDLLANGDGDYGRQRHQNQLLVAVYRQVLSAGTLADPHRLGDLLSTVDKALIIDSGGASLTDWFSSVRGLPGDGLIGIAMNGGQYVTAQQPGLGEVQTLNDTSRQLLDAVRADTVSQFVAAHPDWMDTPTK
ncbi:hypothetical protein GCM10023322_37980 [Rugosimonospora acidiphila]|uniref:Cell envelope-related transcriptional attenuator domain-containing protein n=1 Tax=Rugosimonospora acidiphila TaxID=556531 RepID=A0ABP9RVR0_9ACTN